MEYVVFGIFGWFIGFMGLSYACITAYGDESYSRNFTLFVMWPITLFVTIIAFAIKSPFFFFKKYKEYVNKIWGMM